MTALRPKAGLVGVSVQKVCANKTCVFGIVHQESSFNDMTDWLNTSLVINKYKTKTMGSNSCVTVLRQVVLGLPGFLLPGGVHLKATFVMFVIFLYSSLLEIVFGQKIWHIRLRHLLWNTSIFLVSVFTTLQLSAPYSRTDLTLLL